MPDHSGSLFVVHRVDAGIVHRVDAGRAGDWQLSGGVIYVGKRSGATDASGLILPDYIKVKAALEVPLTPALSARLEADNLLNERYALSSYNSFWIYPGAPRTIRASLSARL